MSYKRKIKLELLEVIRRYLNGQSISRISEDTGFDRKTLRKYIRAITSRGITFDTELITSSKEPPFIGIFHFKYKDLLYNHYRPILLRRTSHPAPNR